MISKLCLTVSNFKMYKKTRTLLWLLLLPFLLICCNKKSETISESNAMITDSPLPAGKQALEDETNIIAPTNTETGMLGSNDNTGEKDGLTKINLSDPEILKRKFKHLLMFHADDTMQVNQSKLATLILSKDELLGKIKAEILEENNSTKDAGFKVDTLVDLGSKMKARLIPFGNSGLENSFNIEPLGDDIQSFKTDRKKLIWQWKITPLKPGKQELKLSIQIIAKDGESVTLPAKNIDVLIMVKPESTLKAIGNFFEKYWQFLITAILIPVITSWVTNIIKNRQPRQKKPPTPPPANETASSTKHSAY